MKVEVSTGELIDKLSILEIKLLNIKDPQKSANVYKELETLNPYFQDLLDEYGLKMKNLYTKISRINKTLWDIEDTIREKEKAEEFDEEFVELARSVYITNDQRAAVKKEINLLTKSELVEEKSYSDY
ncbi:DUF6165 family protein [Akkermansiaceae bacterium]|jgi:hypothetical protein|nr:DUF6165 family protein [Akkermansiaceae bacterium]